MSDAAATARGTNTHGGAREGAGRKPIVPSGEKTKNELWREIERLTADDPAAMTPFKKLVELSVNKEKRTSLTALKLLLEMLTAGESHQKIDVTKNPGPAMYLPQRDPDPALKVVPGKKTA